MSKLLHLRQNFCTKLTRSWLNPCCHPSKTGSLQQDLIFRADMHFNHGCFRHDTCSKATLYWRRLVGCNPLPVHVLRPIPTTSFPRFLRSRVSQSVTLSGNYPERLVHENFLSWRGGGKSERWSSGLVKPFQAFTGLFFKVSRHFKKYSHHRM